MKFRQISPVDEFGNKIGGNGEVLGNVEYIVPLPFNFRVAAFFDIGNVYGFGTQVRSHRPARTPPVPAFGGSRRSGRSGWTMASTSIAERVRTSATVQFSVGSPF